MQQFDLSLPQFQTKKQTIAIHEYVQNTLKLEQVIEGLIKQFPPVFLQNDICARYETTIKTEPENDWVLRLLRTLAHFYGILLHCQGPYKNDYSHYPYCIVGNRQNVNNFHQVSTSLYTILKKSTRTFFERLKYDICRDLVLVIDFDPKATVKQIARIFIESYYHFILTNPDHNIFAPKKIFEKIEQFQGDLKIQKLRGDKVEVKIQLIHAERYGIIECWKMLNRAVSNRYIEVLEKYCDVNLLHTDDQLAKIHQQCYLFMIDNPLRLKRSYKKVQKVNRF